MKVQVSDIIAQTLVAANVKRAYGMIGYGVDVLMDSLAQTDIRFISVTNEEAAGFAAGADAQYSGCLGLCLGSTGPGVVHYLNGIYDAHRNGSPVLFIASQVKQNEIGLNAAQEVDIRTIFTPCSCFCEAVQTPEQLPLILGLAMQTALMKRGVAVVIIPEDMMSMETEFDKPRYIPHISKSVIMPSHDEIVNMATMINAAEKIVIFGGKGCEGAHDKVMTLARKIKAPVGWAYRGKHLLDYDNPYPIGMNGLLGDKSCLEAIHECDLLLLLGTDFAFSTFYPDHCKIIQIDIEGANLARRHWIDYGAVGSIVDTLDELTHWILEKDDDSFARKAAKSYADVEKHLAKLTVQNNESKHHIYPEYLSGVLNRTIDKEAFIVADIGTPWAYMAKYIESHGTRKLYHSCLHGTMANALSSAIGLQAAFPDSQVVAMCGDGGFTMLMGDVLTLVKEQLPVKIVIFNNGRLDFVALEMKTSGLIDYATDLCNTNFAAFAEAVGIKGIRVEQPGNLQQAIEEAFAHQGPVIVDVVVNPDSLLMPPEITFDMMRNFSEYIWKAFVSGEKKTLKEMLEVNLPRQL